MSADLTCPTCEGTRRHPPLHGNPYHAPPSCPDCHEGRRLPTLAEWDALEDERDRLRGDNRDLSAMVLNEREAYEDIEAERDRYRDALERIAAMYAPGAFGIWPVVDDAVAVARAALDSDPDMAEHTKDQSR